MLRFLVKRLWHEIRYVNAIARFKKHCFSYLFFISNSIYSICCVHQGLKLNAIPLSFIDRTSAAFVSGLALLEPVFNQAEGRATTNNGILGIKHLYPY